MNILRILKISLLGLLFFNVVTFAANNKKLPNTFTEEKLSIIITSQQPVFIIKLKSNPTTGYSWFLRDYCSKIIVPVKHRFEASQDKKLVGAPGFELWEFHVKPDGFVVPQQTQIRFVYTRPWESGGEAKQLVFQLTTVKAEIKSNGEHGQ